MKRRKEGAQINSSEVAKIRGISALIERDLMIIATKKVQEEELARLADLDAKIENLNKQL